MIVHREVSPDILVDLLRGFNLEFRTDRECPGVAAYGHHQLSRPDKGDIEPCFSQDGDVMPDR